MTRWPVRKKIRTHSMTKLKIAHISDTHLGYRNGTMINQETGRNQRSVDFERSFTDAVNMILMMKPDLVIHAGDVFHHPRPDWRAVSVFIEEWRQFELANIPTLVISGNHDISRLRTIGTVYDVLKTSLPKTMFVVGRTVQQVPFYDLDVTVTAVPYVADTMIQLDPVESEWNVLVSHGGVRTNLSDPDMRYAGGDPWFDPSQYHYVALGDHHLSYRVADKTWYSGSTERCGFSDERATPGWLWVELEHGKVPAPVHHEVWSRPMKTLEPVTWTGNYDQAVEEILAQVTRWGEPEGIARVHLAEARSSDAGVVQRFANQKGAGKIASVRVYTSLESDNPMGMVLNQKVDSFSWNLEDMFADFVRERNYDDPTFKGLMLEKGLEAISQVKESEREEHNIEGG